MSMSRNIWSVDKMKLIYYEFRLLDYLTKYSPATKEETESDEIRQLLEMYENGQYELIFQMDFVKSILKYENKELEFAKVIDSNINQFFCESPDHALLAERQFKVMFLGAVFLQLFVQVNWTGPEFIIQDLRPQGANWSYHTFGEHGPIYSKVKCLEYLWLSKLILFYDEEAFAPHKTIHWWRLRYVEIYQELLEEKSPELFEQAVDLYDKVLNCPSLVNNLTKNLDAQLNLEGFKLYMHYYEHTKAKKFLEVLHGLVGLSVELFGALGKRTRFQNKDIAQLALRVSKSLIVDDETDYSQPNLPKDLSLGDDVRLEKIKFKDEDKLNFCKLIPIEQAIVLANYLYIQKSNPRSKLVMEELLTYPNLLLDHPQCWSVQMMALLHRSLCESDHRRTIERSMMQIQLLVEQYTATEVPPKHRLYLVYSVSLPPRWVMEKALADLQMQMGAVASALDIYLGLEMWDEVIHCYTTMQRRDKAEAVIRSQLALKETPSLWCCLGDATDDPQYYVKAWELSQFRCARAQKALGTLHFRKKEYAESVVCLKKSVEINSIQTDTWFRLGFAAMQINDWETAALSYRRCVNLEPENYEAWNNLANVYMKQEEKHRAWVALQEALKCQFQEPKIWQNYLLVSVDLRKVAESIEAYHQLLDNNNKYADDQVLGLLVDIMAEDMKQTKEEQEKSADNNSKHYPKLCELFGRITAKVINNSQIWKLYGDLVNAKSEKSSDDIEKVIRLYEKAQRCFFQQSTNWETIPTLCFQFLDFSLELCQLYLKLCANEMNPTKKHMLTAAKVMLNSIIVKAKAYEEANVDTFPDQLSMLLESLQFKRDEMVELIEKDEPEEQPVQKPVENSYLTSN